MSFTEMLETLETLTFEQRQEIIARATELDDLPFTPEEEKMIEERLAEHDRDPSSAIPADEVIRHIQARLSK